MSAPPDQRRAGDRDGVAAFFAAPGFAANLGVTFVDCGPGWCRTRLTLRDGHLQHTGVVYAGVLSTIADHTAGGAAMTSMAAGRVPVTVDKIHLLRAARGTHLECRGDVLKSGTRITIVESTVTAVDGDSHTVVAKLSGTMAPVTA